MTHTRKTLLGAAAAVAVALGTLVSAPIAASASNNQPMYCPPIITEFEAPIAHELIDSHDGPAGWVATIASGSLPRGLTLESRDDYSPRIIGAPLTMGAFKFRVHVEDKIGNTGDVDCSMDVVDPSSIVDRITGANRYEVAIDIAKKVVDYPTTRTAPLVYVASGENFADALSASAIAAQHNAPLLLSTSGELPSSVFNMIWTFGPANIVVVGGEKALSAQVEAQLKTISSNPTVTRIGGADRFAVSRALISHPAFGAMPSTTIAVATGQNFPDALSASPVAGKLKAPVLLVNGGATTLSAEEKTFLAGRGLTSATLYGGKDVLSVGIATDLEAIAGTVSRVDGFDRFAVSAATVAGNYTGPIDTVYLATGANFPDALAGSTLAGINGSPILLTRKSCMTAEVAAQITALAPKHLVLLGGQAVLDATLENQPICS